MLNTMLAALLSAFSWGILGAFLGSIKLRLAPRIGADNAQFGQFIATYNGSRPATTLLTGIAIDLVGHRSILITGALLAALAVFLLGRKQRVRGVILICIVLGVGSQLLNVGGNALFPVIFADSAAGSNLGNAFYGLGGLLAPLIIVYLCRRLLFPRVLTTIAALVFFPFFFVLGGDFPTIANHFDITVLAGLFSSPITWAGFAVIGCYVELEISLGAWLTSYAIELGADEPGTARMLSLLFAGIVLSRFFFGLQHRLTGIDLTPVGGYVLTGAALVVLLAMTALLQTRRLTIVRWVVLATGFAFGPIFPTAVGLTLQHLIRLCGVR